MFEAKELWSLMEIEAEDNGIDIIAVCKRAGVSDSGVFKWSSGLAYPSGYWLKKLRATFVEMMEEQYRPV